MEVLSDVSDLLRGLLQRLAYSILELLQLRGLHAIDQAVQLAENLANDLNGTLKVLALVDSSLNSFGTLVARSLQRVDDFVPEGVQLL